VNGAGGIRGAWASPGDASRGQAVSGELGLGRISMGVYLQLARCADPFPFPSQALAAQSPPRALQPQALRKCVGCVLCVAGTGLGHPHRLWRRDSVVITVPAAWGMHPPLSSLFALERSDTRSLAVTF